MILAAGLGTRLKPFTDKHPKALALVNGKTLLQRNIEYLTSFGINEIIVNVHHFANQIIDHIKQSGRFGADISFSDETDTVLETGGGLMKAASFLKDSNPFVLMNVDVLTDMDLNEMLEVHQKQNPVATLAVTLRETSRYLLFDESDLLCGWENVVSREQKISRTAANYIQKAFSGIHIISPAIFERVERTGKFSMIDVYLDLSRDHAIFGFDHTGTNFVDVGRPESIAVAEELFGS